MPPKLPQHEKNIALDSGWISWLKENIQRGCDPAEIVHILQQNNFSMHSIEAAMGAFFPAPTIQKKFPPIDYKALARVNITRPESGAKPIETNKLQLFTLDNFVSEKESDDLVQIINKYLRPSTVSYDNGDRYFRTSSTCDLGQYKLPLVQSLDHKIAKALGVSVNYSEGIQAQKYTVGQQFKAHTDYFEPGTEEYKTFASAMGNRTWTFMVYLNDVAKGGGTRFVNIDKTFYPKKGMAVIWNNLYEDGKPNPDTLHWGMPVEEGKKIIITKWFRERSLVE